MREIDLNEPADKMPVDTYLIFGGTGSGKTTLCAGWPRPLVLADMSEGGYKALRGLRDDQLFEPERDPIVWGIEQMADMATALQRIPPLIASGQVLTVVVSSITFYAASYLAHLNEQRPNADTRQIYGDLGIHLRQVRTKFHGLGVNVIWEALDTPPEDAVVDPKNNAVIKERQPGGPMIAGQSAKQFSASVTYLWRLTMDVVQKNGAPFEHIPKLHTRALGGYVGRSRVGADLPQLPSPMLGGYRGFLHHSGYDIEAIRRNLPPINGKKTIAVSTAAKPTTAPKVASPPSGAQAATTSRK